MNNSSNERVSKFFKDAGNLGRATIIGLGGGGEIALHLFRSGVSEMNLIDFDILEEGNLVRHACCIEHIGQNKAIAMKNFLERYAGFEQNRILAHTWNIFDESEKFKDIVSSSDVVIVATDNDSSKYFANEACRENNVPAVFVGMYEDGCGGEIMASLSDKGCFECAAHFQDRREYLGRYARSASKKDCSSVRDTGAMPGLGIDQSFLCAIAARKALDILVAKAGGNSLPPIGKNLIIWSLFGIPGITENHLSSIQFDIPKHKDCSICSS